MNAKATRTSTLLFILVLLDTGNSSYVGLSGRGHGSRDLWPSAARQAPSQQGDWLSKRRQQSERMYAAKPPKRRTKSRRLAECKPKTPVGHEPETCRFAALPQMG